MSLFESPFFIVLPIELPIVLPIGLPIGLPIALPIVLPIAYWYCLVLSDRSQKSQAGPAQDPWPPKPKPSRSGARSAAKVQKA